MRFLMLALLVGCGASRPPEPPPPRPVAQQVPAPEEPTPPVEPPPPPPPVSSGPDMLDYACVIDAQHFGGHYVAHSIVVNLTEHTYLWIHVDRAAGDPPNDEPAIEPPRRALDAAQRTRIDELVHALLARSDWPSDPAVPDGGACMLSLRQSGGRSSIVSVQRQGGAHHDAVDRLIALLRALPDPAH